MDALNKGRRLLFLLSATAFLLSVLSLSGCGTFVAGDEDVFASDYAARLKEQVHPGVTARSDLRELFGTPITSSETWRIELFRIDNEDFYTVWGGMILLPGPIWSETATQAIYALAVYDSDWKVSDFGTGYFVEEIHEFRRMQQKDAVAGGFRLEVGSILRELEPESECLYAPRAATEAVLSAQPKAGACTIYLVNSGDNARLFVDGNIYFNPRGTLSRGFLAVSVLPGKHEIKVDPYHRYGGSLDYKGEAKTEVNCIEGQRLFVEIKPDISYEPSLFRRSTLTAEFLVSNEPLDVFKAFPLILYHNEKWIGPDKPNYDRPVR
jgi:hypothetical protein